MFNVFSILISNIKVLESILDYLKISKNVMWVLLVSGNLDYIKDNCKQTGL